jgi:hypothetical protein
MKPMLRTFALLFVLAALVLVARSRGLAGDVAVMPMGTHMDMTVKRQLEPGDRERADAILAALKAVMQKYADVQVAQADGYAQFKPQLHLPQAHFTNLAYAKEAWSGHFDASRPTALMYRRNGNGWTLEGVMYTAPPSASQAQLDAAAPLSIAQWHRHTDVCTGPADSTARDYYGPAARFGLAGSIHDEASCLASGGSWKNQIYGWMLHVWPMESDPAKVWMLHPDGSDEAMHGSMKM